MDQQNAELLEGSTNRSSIEVTKFNFELKCFETST